MPAFEIKETGIAFDKGEIDKDIHTIAAPVFNHDNNPVAAVVVGIPVTRLACRDESSMVDLLKDTAKNISLGLGN